MITFLERLLEKFHDKYYYTKHFSHVIKKERNRKDHNREIINLTFFVLIFIPCTLSAILYTLDASFITYFVILGLHCSIMFPIYGYKLYKEYKQFNEFFSTATVKWNVYEKQADSYSLKEYGYFYISPDTANKLAVLIKEAMKNNFWKNTLMDDYDFYHSRIHTDPSYSNETMLFMPNLLFYNLLRLEELGIKEKLLQLKIKFGEYKATSVGFSRSHVKLYAEMKNGAMKNTGHILQTIERSGMFFCDILCYLSEEDFEDLLVSVFDEYIGVCPPGVQYILFAVYYNMHRHNKRMEEVFKNSEYYGLFMMKCEVNN